METQPVQNPNPNPPAPPPPPPPQIGGMINPYSQRSETPYVTYGMLVLIVGIFLFTFSQGAGQDARVLIQYGSTYGPWMLTEGEMWRIVTSMFLHANTSHILFNALALYYLGREIEQLYGSPRFAILYFLSGIAGGLLSFALRGPEEFSVGASGAIFGIAGVNLAFFYFYRERLGQFGEERFRGMLQTVGINLVLGFVVISINNWAHIGGLVAGVALGFMVLPEYIITETIPTIEFEDQRSLRRRGWVLLLFFGFLVASGYLIQQFWLQAVIPG